MAKSKSPSPLDAYNKALTDGKHVTPNIVLGQDGKYHWYYEMNMLTNPSILFVVLKIFFWIFFVMAILLSILQLCEGDSLADVGKFLGQFMIFILCALTFATLGYMIYALAVGRKYCVLFTMSEHGVTHTQVPNQFRKAQKLGGLLVLAGAATRNPGRMGQGMLVASHQSMSSDFKAVRSVEVFRRRHLIKVNELLCKNQVYAAKEDFDFVCQYIKAHVSPQCKISD